MKRKINLFLLNVLTCCAISACGGGSSNTDSTSNISSVEQTSASESEVTISESTNRKYVEDMVLDEERVYSGYVVNNIPNGEGELTWVLTNCVYTGNFKNGLYDGEGLFEWRNNGDKLEGTFEFGYPTYGTFTYKNTMHYTGSFNANWEFNGQGTFDWRTYRPNGAIMSEGWLYEGEFRNGTIIGCRGKVTFDQKDSATPGVKWFEGVMNAFPGVKPNQNGKAKIVYPDKSIYTGEVYYDGADYLRKGYGIQDFSPMKVSVEGAWGAKADEYFDKYVGYFDYQKGGWIYGDGVMYYTDKDGNPNRWSKGFFSACHLLKPYTSKDAPELLDGYTASMESPYIRFRDNYDVYFTDKKWEPKKVDFLFVGDSYMTFMNIMPDTPFSKYFGDLNGLDVGCGGATTADWINYYETLVKSYNPSNIVLSIGGNDIRNLSTIDDVATNLHIFIDMILKDFPSVKIYLAEKCMNFAERYDNGWKNEMNAMFHNDIATAYTCVTVMNLTDIFQNGDTPIENIQNYFLSDGIHMNNAGYTLWTNRIREYIVK